MNFILTSDFKMEVFILLREYDNKPLNLMIAGGSLLDILDNPSYKSLDSTQWKIWYADERCHKSHLNYTGSLRFLEKLTPKNVYKINVESENCVEEYRDCLEKIDLCLLGIGDDGHICSLFPESDDLDSNEFVIKTYNPEVVSPDRVTVTIKFLNTMVNNLYFVIPPKKDGTIKSMIKPHERITRRLRVSYISILDKRFNSCGK